MSPTTSSVFSEAELLEHIAAAKAALLRGASGHQSYGVGRDSFEFASLEALRLHLAWLRRELAGVLGTGGHGLLLARPRIGR